MKNFRHKDGWIFDAEWKADNLGKWVRDERVQDTSHSNNKEVNCCKLDMVFLEIDSLHCRLSNRWCLEVDVWKIVEIV